MAVSPAPEPNEWQVGLLDCCEDSSTFWLGCCFLPGLYGQNQSYLDDQSMCLHSALYATFCCCACCIHTSRRRLLRKKYNLQTSGNDCLVVWCCPFCAVIQESREIAAHMPLNWEHWHGSKPQSQMMVINSAQQTPMYQQQPAVGPQSY